LKKHIVLSAIGALLAVGAGSAIAEPKNGFGLDGGIVTSHMSNPLGNYQSSGLSIGIDYQFAISESFSINPFLMSSGESTSGALIPGTKAGHGILGLQLRYWINDMFIGGHLASYSEILSNSVGNITASTTATGGGAGLVAGWENPNGGMFVMGQLDSAKLQYTGSTSKMSGFRLSMGYRWK
jgi:hypothetical protein